MRTRAARRDENEADIIDALKKFGCTVCQLSQPGVPDLLVGLVCANGVPINLLLEIKDGAKAPSDRKLTDKEKLWHEAWKGQVEVVESVIEAIDAINWARQYGGRTE